ncbi:unnamed protein product [Peronospora belbahrii]|uniref:Uncharacterized protein n=1 Tax=Peronospora belbahrii TaxID=622444 RepID=A0ABN8CN55_9STRA|nr:unnamed protein product [Peronospora belbahrii]
MIRQRYRLNRQINNALYGAVNYASQLLRTALKNELAAIKRWYHWISLPTPAIGRHFQTLTTHGMRSVPLLNF